MQKVFAEETLSQRPVLRQLPGVFHQRVYPGDAAFGVLVFDAVAGLGVVFHHFAGAYAALGVYLVEDDGAVAGDAEAVFLDEGCDGDGVKEGAKEGDEVGVVVGADAPGYDVGGNRVHFVHRCGRVDRWTLVDRLRFPVGPGMTGDFSTSLEMTIIVLTGSGFGVVLEVLAGGVVVAAPGFVVTSTNGFVWGLACGIDINCEAALPAAMGQV